MNQKLAHEYPLYQGKMVHNNKNRKKHICKSLIEYIHEFCYNHTGILNSRKKEMKEAWMQEVRYILVLTSHVE